MSYTLINESTRKARKKRPCIWCGEAILPGEVYHHQVGKYYGDLQVSNYHPECRKAAIVFFRDECDFDPHSFKRGTTEER